MVVGLSNTHLLLRRKCRRRTCIVDEGIVWTSDVSDVEVGGREQWEMASAFETQCLRMKRKVTFGGRWLRRTEASGGYLPVLYIKIIYYYYYYGPLFGRIGMQGS